MNIWSLTDGTTELQFFPELDVIAGTVRYQSTHRSRGGDRYGYVFGDANKWSIPISYVSSSFRAMVHTWFDSGTVLSLTPGYTTEASTVSLTGATAPFDAVAVPYDNQWSGTMELSDHIDCVMSELYSIAGTVEYESSVGVGYGSPVGIWWDKSGAKLFVTDDGSAVITQYQMNSAWDLAGSGVYVGDFDTSSYDMQPHGIHFSEDETRVFFAGHQNDSIYQFTSNNAASIVDSMTYDGSFYVGSYDTTPTGVALSPDGKKMYVPGMDTSRVYQFTLTDSFSITGGVTFDGSVDISVLDNSIQGIAVNDGGKRFHLVGNQSDAIFQFTTATSGDFLSANNDAVYYVTSQDTLPADVFLGDGGVRMYFVGAWNGKAYQYTIARCE